MTPGFIIILQKNKRQSKRWIFARKYTIKKDNTVSSVGKVLDPFFIFPNRTIIISILEKNTEIIVNTTVNYTAHLTMNGKLHCFDCYLFFWRLVINQSVINCRSTSFKINSLKTFKHWFKIYNLRRLFQKKTYIQYRQLQ